MRRDDGIVVVEMFEEPPTALMSVLRDFLSRHEIFVEAREFDDGLLGDTAYSELLGLVQRHRRASRSRAANRRVKARQPRRQP